MINAKKYRKTIEWERLEIYLFKKIRGTKGTCKDGPIKDRNGKNIIEAEEIKKE